MQSNLGRLFIDLWDSVTATPNASGLVSADFVVPAGTAPGQ
jgi:hypothetical protein